MRTDDQELLEELLEGHRPEDEYNRFCTCCGENWGELDSNGECKRCAEEGPGE